jgi:hypothetical protein
MWLGELMGVQSLQQLLTMQGIRGKNVQGADLMALKTLNLIR